MKQTEYKARGDGQSQCNRILRTLLGNAGRWVSMISLWRVSGAMAVHSRIADLRKRGHGITQKSLRVNGVVHSYYKLGESV